MNAEQIAAKVDQYVELTLQRNEGTIEVNLLKFPKRTCLEIRQVTQEGDTVLAVQVSNLLAKENGKQRLKSLLERLGQPINIRTI